MFNKSFQIQTICQAVFYISHNFVVIHGNKLSSMVHLFIHDNYSIVVLLTEMVIVEYFNFAYLLFSLRNIPKDFKTSLSLEVSIDKNFSNGFLFWKLSICFPAMLNNILRLSERDWQLIKWCISSSTSPDAHL